MSIKIETLRPECVKAAAKVWHDGWMQAHKEIVPKALTALRTLSSLEIRMKENQPVTLATMEGEQLLGFIMVKGDEVYQMYVSEGAQGKGVAQALMQRGEEQMREMGHTLGWLACAIGNERASKFYTKCGWKNAGIETVELDTLSDPFPLQIWRFEKRL